jgi:hypothetical protein
MYQFGQSSYTINAGDTVTVDALLMETGTSLLNTDGLIAAGVRINYSGGSASVLSDADITGNPGFDVIIPDTTQLSSAGLTELAFLNPPVLATGNGPQFDVLVLGHRVMAANLIRFVFLGRILVSVGNGNSTKKKNYYSDNVPISLEKSFLLFLRKSRRARGKSPECHVTGAISHKCQVANGTRSNIACSASSPKTGVANRC